MTEEPQPTQKFKGRLGSGFSQFGNSTAEEENTKTAKRQTAKNAKAQKSKTDQEQEEGSPGRTFYIPDDLHLWLKMYATLRHTTMSKIVIAELEKLRRKYPLESLFQEDNE
jgi:hypothetical protein